MAGRDRKRRGARGKTVGGRDATVRVRTAKGRKPSSTRWLRRQLNDPYVAAAARLLNMKRSTLHDRLRRLGIDTTRNPP